MRSKEQTLKLRKKYLGPSLSLAYENPIKIVRGKGQYLYDENGREYLDCDVILLLIAQLFRNFWKFI